MAESSAVTMVAEMVDKRVVSKADRWDLCWVEQLVEHSVALMVGCSVVL